VLDDVENIRTVVHLNASVQADDTAQAHALAAAFDKFLREQVRGPSRVVVTPAAPAPIVMAGPPAPFVCITPAPQHEVVTYTPPPMPTAETERPVVEPEEQAEPAAEAPKKRRGRPPKAEVQPEPVVEDTPEPAPVVEDTPEPAPVVEELVLTAPEPEPAPAPVVKAPEPAFFAAREPEPEPESPSKLSGGTLKVNEQQFACTYSQTGAYVSCKVIINEEMAKRLDVEVRTFTSTADSKKDAAAFVAEQMADFFEMQRWSKQKFVASAPAKEAEMPEVKEQPKAEPAPAPAPEPELTAADDPKVPPAVLRIMIESRKLTDTAVRSEVVSLWCEHLYVKHGITDPEAILSHMTRNQSRLVMFEKKPLGSSALRLIQAMTEGFKQPRPGKATAFKPEAPEAVTSVPGDDEIDESEIPY
jgi:hypothetical protein